MSPRIWQQIEGTLVFVAALLIYWLGGQGFGLWLSLLLFFAPDLSFAGYLAGPARGAQAYNTVHLYGFGAAVMGIGALAGWPVLTALGLLWLGHSGFDRMLGYGLKLPEGFQFTHMGRIGKDRATGTTDQNP